MKFAVSTYSFSQLIQSGKMTQLECIDKAKEMGFDGVEIVDIPENIKETPESYAKKIAEKAAACEIEISNFAFCSDLINGCEGDTQKEIERVKTLIDAAAIMGAPGIRHDVCYGLGKYRSYGQAFPLIAESCRDIAAYGAEKGVRVMTENHGYISQDSIRMEQLFNAVQHPSFSLLTDIGNFLCADENPVAAVSRVAPYTGYVHVKDFLVKSGSEPNPGKGFFQSRGGNYLRGTVLGHGRVPVQQCLQILDKAGYDGYVTLEYEGMEPALDAIAIGFENLKQYLKNISA